MTDGRPGSAVVRRAPDFFILAFLALQVALPLSYYLGSGDSHDERFAWRMFSTARLASCSVEVADEIPGDSRRKVELGRDLQEAWVSWLRRGDPTVVDALAQRLCRSGALAVDYRRTCRSGEGSPLPPEERRIPCSR